MYRLVASDLDETLLDDSHHVPERVRRAVAAARQLGVRFVPATGRPFGSVDVTLSELGLLGQKGEYVISFNGGVITENSSGVPLTTCSLPRETAERIYSYGVERNICMHVNTLDPVYLYNYVPEERAYIEGRMNIVETFDPTLDAIYDVTDGLDVYYSGNRYLEFNAPGVNKGAGLLELARRLGIRREETMAIGDNSNDAAMLRAAGLGIAVANASPEALSAADYVCKADNNAGGVAEAIERFILGA